MDDGGYDDEDTGHSQDERGGEEQQPCRPYHRGAVEDVVDEVRILSRRQIPWDQTDAQEKSPPAARADGLWYLVLPLDDYLVQGTEVVVVNESRDSSW